MKLPLRIGVGVAGVACALSSLACTGDAKAHWVSTTLYPPAPFISPEAGPCLKICVNASQAAGETLQIYNGCPREALSLNGPYFAPLGQSTFSWDGAITAYTDNVAPGQTAVFVASLAADQKTDLTLTGTLGGSFETLTIILADGGGVDANQPLCHWPDGGVHEASTALDLDAGEPGLVDSGQQSSMDAGTFRDSGQKKHD